MYLKFRDIYKCMSYFYINVKLVFFSLCSILAKE